MSNVPGASNAADPKAIRIRSQAGGTLTNQNVDAWLDPSEINPMSDSSVVDVYIEQVCYYVNQSRGLIGPDAPPGCMRAVLSQPQTFYQTLQSDGGEIGGSQMLRAAGISPAEFRQLEIFFVPIDFNEHSSLVVISPLDRTVELADASRRSRRAMSKIFAVVVRFLVHELGRLAGPAPWRFLHGHAPRQSSMADCGNYTCLFAKALALQRPLGPDTDVGQGPDGEREDGLKRLVIDDLCVPEWTARRFPMGNEDPVLRHYGPDTASVPQHSLFSTPDPNPDSAAVESWTFRSRTGRHDRLTVAELCAWCRAQPEIPDQEGNMVSLMRDYEQWALLGLQEFVRRVEEREADIMNDLFP